MREETAGVPSVDPDAALPDEQGDRGGDLSRARTAATQESEPGERADPEDA